jgi:hypothetical protein
MRNTPSPPINSMEITHDILNPLPMAYWPPTHGMSTPYPWYIDPHTHGISIPYPWYFHPLPMEYRTLYPWYFEPLPTVFWLPTHVILTPYPWYIDPLPMVYQPLSFGRNEEGQFTMRGFKVQWRKINPGSIYHMKIDHGVNIPWGSKYHMTTGLMNKCAKSW